MRIYKQDKFYQGVDNDLYDTEVDRRKESYKHAFEQQRCLILADGFYEWKRHSKKSKVPYRIQLRTKQLFAFAGIWEEYIDDQEHDNFVIREVDDKIA